MTSLVTKALLTAALAAFLPAVGQEPPTPAAKTEPVKDKPAEARPVASTHAAKTKAAAKIAKPKSDPAVKGMFGPPNPNAPLTPTPSTKVPLPSRKKPPKIPYEQRVNLNGASREELMKLPLVDGPQADKIIAGRPYKLSGELLTRNIVPGAHFWTLKEKVTAGKYAGPAKK